MMYCQEFVPKNVLPDDFLRAIKNSDYSSVSAVAYELIYSPFSKENLAAAVLCC